ncbi:MAG: bifunctional heptose 7-phosphate kinase/heptose 1-phosphate adenyltransferase [Promethearchaeota archaeon]
MSFVEEINKWKDKKILIIGDALVDKYIFGYADRISPDAPIPNIKIESNEIYIGAIGLVLQFIKSLGGIPKVCTVIGNDFEGNFFLKKIKELNIDSSGILVEETISTPQITRIKAMNQHVLRLESDYNVNISENIIEKFLKILEARSQDIDSILVLNYETGHFFEDNFIQKLIHILKKNYKDVPIVARPTTANYYLYEGIELIRMNLQKALQTFSIECCNETSASIVGKRILNSSNSKNVLLNYLESESYLFSKDYERAKRIPPILQEPARSYVAVGSVIMAILGLSLASKIKILDAVKIALFAAALTATLPPIEFYDIDKLKTYILANSNIS